MRKKLGMVAVVLLLLSGLSGGSGSTGCGWDLRLDVYRCR